MPSIELSCPVFPSEDPVKVETAVKKIFPDAVVKIEDQKLTGTSSSLDYFRKEIRRQKILDATRNILIRGKRGNVTRFFMNKQAAFVGQISFCEEKMILGTIRVIIQDDQLDALIDNIAPETVDGEEVLI